MTYKNGDIYKGKWLGGRKHGKGVYIYHNSYKEKGIWQ